MDKGEQLRWLALVLTVSLWMDSYGATIQIDLNLFSSSTTFKQN